MLFTVSLIAGYRGSRNIAARSSERCGPRECHFLCLGAEVSRRLRVGMKIKFHRIIDSTAAVTFAVGLVLLIVLTFIYPLHAFTIAHRLPDPLGWLIGTLISIGMLSIPPIVVAKFCEYGSLSAFYYALGVVWLMNIFLVWVYILK